MKQDLPYYIVAGLALVMLQGCHWLRHDDPYRIAESAKPVGVPAGVTMRPAQELYPIPDIKAPVGATAKTLWVSTENDAVPPPVPLKLNGSGPGTKLGIFKWELGMTEDGNGFPILTISGAGFDQTWDELQNVLALAHVHVTDRNRQLALVYLGQAGGKKSKKDQVDDQGQLKLVRGVDSWQLAVQKNADSMAPADSSRVLLQKIMAAWPKSAD